jgi:hypothetical protein
MVMEHAEALERIEMAAVEPEGIERLMAGDTPDAAAVAGHLAGCPSCADELVRIRRTSVIVREIVRSEPDPALRDRTLAFVKAVGRDRTGAATTEPAAAPTPAIAVLPAPVAAIAPAPGTAPVRGAVRPARRGMAFLAVAAAVVIAVGVGYLAGGASERANTTASQQEVAILSEAAATAVQIQTAPDAERVALTPTAAGAGSQGTLTFSATSGELVAVATGLTVEGPNEEYGCWVEVNGQRQRLGRMYWAGDVWTWAGPVQGLDAIGPGAVFGVSLTHADGASGEPVLTGSL